MGGWSRIAGCALRAVRSGKALGNGKRLELIELLAQGPRGVAQRAEAAGLGVTTTSAHLQTLKDAELVAADRAGTTIRYRISGRDLAALYDGCLPWPVPIRPMSMLPRVAASDPTILNASTVRSCCVVSTAART